MNSQVNSHGGSLQRLLRIRSIAAGVCGTLLLFSSIIFLYSDSPFSWNIVQTSETSGENIDVTTGLRTGNSKELTKTLEQVKPDAQLCQPNDAMRFLLTSINSKESKAKCIDGSRPAFYLRRGTGSGKAKWLVHFEGGGWCWDPKQCYERSLSFYGSSQSYPRCLARNSMKDILSANSRNNPLFYNWNVIHVKYCDGTSYAGNAEISYQGKTLFFRGRENRDETIRALLTMGMQNSSEVVISGCSAGALGVYLGIDRITELIHRVNPAIPVRGLPLSGFFRMFSSGEDAPANIKAARSRDDGIINNKLDYANALRSVFTMTNMSAGADRDCLSAHSANPSDCAFASSLGPHISTPIFSVQPQYDSWQLLHILAKNFSAAAANAFGQSLTSELISSLHYANNNPGHGSFIESCAHHCLSCSVDEDTWHGAKVVSTLERLSPASAFKEWYSNSLEISSQSSGNGAISRKMPPMNIFLQNHSYPCSTCCACSVKPVALKI